MYRGVFRLLMPDGALLLDLPNKAYVVKHFSPRSWHEANQEIVVCRQRTRHKDMIFCRETVISKIRGLIWDGTYCTRLYSPQKITGLLSSLGFSSIAIQKGFVSHKDKGNYGAMTNRMIVIARKP